MKGKQKCQKKVIRLSFAVLLWSTLVLQSGGGASFLTYAAELKKTESITQDEAIRAAKKWVEISDDHKLVHAKLLGEYNDYHDQPLWKLAWSNKKGSSFIAYIDASTGILLSYDGTSGVTNAQVSEEVALEKAKQFMQRAIDGKELEKLSKPNEFKHLLSSSLYQSSKHVFTFTRIENGIPFIENGFELIVAPSGEIEEFYRDWHEGELPAVKPVISEKEAEALFLKLVTPALINMELYTITRRDTDEGQYRLVYGYRDTDPQFVDALSGAVINETGKPPAEKRLQTLGKTFPADDAAKTRLDTQQEAQKLAEQYMSHFPGVYRVESNGMSLDNWSFTVTSLDKTVKKKKPIKLILKPNGEIMEYLAEGSDDVPVKEEGIPYALAEVRAIKLVKTFYGNRLGEIYVMEPLTYQKDTKHMLVMGGYYTVKFGWMNEGVPIENAYMEVFVNIKTGEAEYLSSHGNSKPLHVNQLAAGIVSPEVARKAEQENKRWMLTYYRPKYAPEYYQIMLVYRLVGESGVVDAHTGKWLSFSELRNEQEKP